MMLYFVLILFAYFPNAYLLLTYLVVTMAVSLAVIVAYDCLLVIRFGVRRRTSVWSAKHHYLSITGSH